MRWGRSAAASSTGAGWYGPVRVGSFTGNAPESGATSSGRIIPKGGPVRYRQGAWELLRRLAIDLVPVPVESGLLLALPFTGQHVLDEARGHEQQAGDHDQGGDPDFHAVPLTPRIASDDSGSARRWPALTPTSGDTGGA